MLCIAITYVVYFLIFNELATTNLFIFQNFLALKLLLFDLQTVSACLFVFGLLRKIFILVLYILKLTVRCN